MAHARRFKGTVTRNFIKKTVVRSRERYAEGDSKASMGGQGRRLVGWGGGGGGGFPKPNPKKFKKNYFKH